MTGSDDTKAGAAPMPRGRRPLPPRPAPRGPGGAPRGRTTVHQHPERARIELALAQGRSLRSVSKEFGVGISALHRYKQNHMPPQLIAALQAKALKPGVDLERLRIEESNGLLQNLAAQRAKLLLAQDEALARKELPAVATLGGQVHRNLELVGKYLGEFARHQVQTSVSITIQPEYLRLRAAVVKALRPYPEAAREVARVLQELEGRAAEGFTKPPATIDVTPLSAAEFKAVT